MSGRTKTRSLGAVVTLAFTAWCASAGAQPVGPAVRFGGASFQQLGNSMLVTTSNGAGTNRSVIDWRSFSVPAGSVTHFLQPSADSTSINRVTGNKPSEIFGTLSSNGHLVLVNPSGIAVGTGAVIDTAGFTASALSLSDDDAIAGRMRFHADKGKQEVNMQGRVLARSGDIVLLGTSVQVEKDALLQAPNGTVLLAAGQQVALTGRGLEGIVLEVTAPSDKAVNMGRLQGDAVGIFASQLKHTGAIQAGHVILQGGKVRLEVGGKDKEKEKEKENEKPDKEGNGNNGNGNGNAGNGSQDASATPPDDSIAGSIVTTQSPAAPTNGGSPAPVQQQGDPPAASSAQAQVLVDAMESRAAASILNNGEVIASLKAPELPDYPPGRTTRSKPDPALQCTR